jgi:resuscitation-promoting factor RpfB
MVAAVILPACGGVMAIGALAGENPKPAVTDVPVAEQVVGTTATTTTTAPAPTAPAPERTTIAPQPLAATTTTTAAAPTAPAVTRRTVKVTKPIAYPTRRVDDDSLAKGRTKVRTRGVDGTRTLTYAVTLTGGKETSRTLVGDVVTRQPVAKVIAVGTKESECDPNYSGCVPIAEDVDCAGGTGNGPAYVQGPVRVIGEDIYDLDNDNDGIGCES